MNNFGNLKDIFNEILLESVIKKDNNTKKLIKEYFKTIKNSNVLKTQFLVYTNLEEKSISNEQSAWEYIKENIALLDKFTKKNIIEENKKLEFILNNKVIDVKNELYEHINTLILTKKTPKTIDRIHESMEFVKNHIMKEKEIVKEEVNESIVEVPISVLTNITVNKFNSKYENLSETEKKTIKSILQNNEEDQKNVFIDLIRECVDAIDERLKESDIELKDKLLKAKDKVLRMNFNKESFINDVNKISNLREDLIKKIDIS